MEIAALGRAALLIALASACHAVANGAETETLKIDSAPRILGPLKGFVGHEETHVTPNGETIITGLGHWKEEQEPIEVVNNFTVGPKPQDACTPKPKVNDHETYVETSREVAKTQVAKSPIDKRNLTVKGYRASLPSDADMRQKYKISTHCYQERVDVEQKNVTVAAYLIAAKKEGDNDYHLILQDNDCNDPSCRLTVEISGIPRLTTDEILLSTVREKFKQQWVLYTGRNEITGSGGFVFFITPILVRVTGSTFYDPDHPVDQNTGTGPVGPEGLRPGSAWEVHPVTSFEFDPKTEVSPFALANPAHNE